MNGTTIAINSPPARGPNMANSAAVEVIVGQPQELALAKVFRSGTFDVGARAVATVGGGPSYCVLQLDPHARVGLHHEQRRHGDAGRMRRGGQFR